MKRVEMSLDTFDDMLAEDVRDPYPEFVRLRRESPVLAQEPSYEGAPPSFVVYRHADVNQVLRDGETFSSGVIAEGMRDVWGATVTAMLGSANRDPDAYNDPESFDIFRDPNQHMSFGTGPHLCLGMHLARLETRVALDALLDRLPNLRIDQHEAERVDAHIHGSMVFRSPTNLPVLWDHT